MTAKTFDFAVIGAGCFGAWTAHELLRAGYSVVLLDAYGAGHSRSSSGGESRIIRMGYGADVLYTRWAMQSLTQWQALAERVQLPIFHRSGMLWLAGRQDSLVPQMLRTFADLDVAHEQLAPDELARRFPQISPADIEWALWEPEAGVLMARQAVQALVAEAVGQGLEYRVAQAVSPDATQSRLGRILTSTGDSIAAGSFVFACGAWLPKVFPQLLGPRIFPSRQEVFFFSPPPGDQSFAPPAMPAWYHHPAFVYGIPDLENRGFKISVDKHGAAFDPDTSSRMASADGLEIARAYLMQRFPKLKNAPLTESRVCQYENTSNGDFLIDRHPDIDNVAIIGGGSGHGFKHGPAVGAYTLALLTGSAAVEPRFALTAKETTQSRSVF
jgi:monomeric sarcosine oxidase